MTRTSDPASDPVSEARDDRRAPPDCDDEGQQAKRSSIPSAPEASGEDCYPPAKARLEDDEEELASHSDDVD